MRSARGWLTALYAFNARMCTVNRGRKRRASASSRCNEFGAARKKTAHDAL